MEVVVLISSSIEDADCCKVLERTGRHHETYCYVLLISQCTTYELDICLVVGEEPTLHPPPGFKLFVLIDIYSKGHVRLILSCDRVFLDELFHEHRRGQFDTADVSYLLKIRFGEEFWYHATVNDQRRGLIWAPLWHCKNVCPEAVHLLVELLFVSGVQGQKAEQDGYGNSYAHDRKQRSSPPPHQVFNC
ncbi:Uncharacterised protein [uncultured archaeon]|nr:Uncharacterised protein [uncultured archaeon]